MNATAFFEKTASRKGSLEPRIVKRLAQDDLGEVPSVEERPSTRQDTKEDGNATPKSRPLSAKPSQKHLNLPKQQKAQLNQTMSHFGRKLMRRKLQVEQGSSLTSLKGFQTEGFKLATQTRFNTRSGTTMPS